MIERLNCHPVQGEICSKVEHVVIQTEDFEIRQYGEASQGIVEIVKGVLYATFVFIQHGSGDGCLRLRYTSSGFGPREEPTNRVRLLARLTFRQDRLSRLPDTDVS
jgi:hypothetical protein